MKTVAIGLLVGFIFIYHFDQQGQGKWKEEKLLYIVNSLEEMNASISEWSIYYRYPDRYIDSVANFREMERNLKNKYPDFQWVKDSDNDHHVTLTGKSNKNGNSEQVSLTMIKDEGRYKVLQTYSFTGEKWSPSEYLNLVKEIEIEDQKSLYFTVRADINEKKYLTLSDQAKEVLGDLSAEPVESLEEDDFISISAFKDTWSNYITTKSKEKINVQLGMRKNVDDGSINLTIGSPIITVEY